VPVNWWSAVALGGHMTGGGGVGNVRPDEREGSATSPVISAGPLVPIS